MSRWESSGTCSEYFARARSVVAPTIGSTVVSFKIEACLVKTVNPCSKTVAGRSCAVFAQERLKSIHKVFYGVLPPSLGEARREEYR